MSQGRVGVTNHEAEKKKETFLQFMRVSARPSRVLIPDAHGEVEKCVKMPKKW